MKPILAGSAALLAYLVGRSLGWPLVHDTPLMHYVAWRIEEGAVPYRDVFDMNWPGVYWVHLGVLRTLGGGDAAWRCFDLAWLGATAGLIYRYARPFGDAWAAAAAAVLFALYHVAGGAWHAGQRDLLLCPLLLLGAAGVAAYRERGRVAALAGGGLALGGALVIKPHALLFLIAVIAIAAVVAGRLGQPRARAVAALVGSALLLPALALVWLAALGALESFLDVMTGYVLPLYSRVGRVPVWRSFTYSHAGWPFVTLVATLVATALVLARPGLLDIRRVLALAGAGYGLLHFALQGKGWEYHLYPLALFLCVLAAAACARPAAPAGGRAGARWRRLVAPVAVAGFVVFLGVKGVAASDAPWIAAKERRVAALARDLAPLVPRGETVQVLDVTSGGIHALYRLRLLEPTRFLYDFHFFHHPGDPRIEKLRAELVAGLEARPPAAIVVLADGWIHGGYERLGAFPALAELLARRYRPAVEGDGYRIHAKRADP